MYAVVTPALNDEMQYFIFVIKTKTEMVVLVCKLKLQLKLKSPKSKKLHLSYQNLADILTLNNTDLMLLHSGLNVVRLKTLVSIS